MARNQQTFSLLALSVLVLSWTAASPVFAGSAGQYVEDATITAKIKKAIHADPELKILRINVDTVEGAVVLSGTVDTKMQENQAMKVVSLIKGVTDITNHMSIQSVDAD